MPLQIDYEVIYQDLEALATYANPEPGWYRWWRRGNEFGTRSAGPFASRVEAFGFDISEATVEALLAIHKGERPRNLLSVMVLGRHGLVVPALNRGWALTPDGETLAKALAATPLPKGRAR